MNSSNIYKTFVSTESCLQHLPKKIPQSKSTPPFLTNHSLLKAACLNNKYEITYDSLAPTLSHFRASPI